MTQKELIFEYIKENGSFLPAKMSGFIYKGEMIGSQCDKRCREMRAEGTLISEPDGRFERFFLNKNEDIEEIDIEYLFKQVKPVMNEKYVSLLQTIKNYQKCRTDEDKNRHKRAFMFLL